MTNNLARLATSVYSKMLAQKCHMAAQANHPTKLQIPQVLPLRYHIILHYHSFYSCKTARNRPLVLPLFLVAISSFRSIPNHRWLQASTPGQEHCIALVNE